MFVSPQEGVLLVGGNSKYDVCLSPTKLAENGHSILGVPRGTKQQLEELVDAFAQGLVSFIPSAVFMW